MVKPRREKSKRPVNLAIHGLFGGINPGGVLLSHTVACAVPSALGSLTTEFGMGSGVTSPPLPPGSG
jgi:hypothetical protein